MSTDAKQDEILARLTAIEESQAEALSVIKDLITEIKPVVDQVIPTIESIMQSPILRTFTKGTRK